MDILTIIPARGGSKRIKHKNLLPVGDIPLVTLAVDAVNDADRLLGNDITLHPILSTDDPQIQSVVQPSILVHLRDEADDDETIGDLVAKIVDAREWDGPVAVVQPTSVAEPADIAEQVKRWINLGANFYMATASPMTGLYWGPDANPLFGDRVNSQWLGPVVWKENGALRIYPADEQDYNRNPDDIFELDVVDIDVWGDLQRVRSEHGRGRVVFDIVATERAGAGHLYRAMSIAEELQHHEVLFIDTGLVEPWARDILHKAGWRVSRSAIPKAEAPNVWICDRLNTTIHHITSRLVDGWKVVTLEDQGHGARYADLVVNAMYRPDPNIRSLIDPDTVTGPEWAIVRPEFLVDDWAYTVDGRTVLLLFGGTDPKDLTYQVADALTSSDHVDTVVMTGPGYKGAYNGLVYDGPVARAMGWADLLVTSGGRTVYEAAAFGIPTVVIAQNLRETTHVHLGATHGNLYLGLADTVTPKTILETVEGLMLFPDPRREMSAKSKMMVDGKGLRRIVRRIEDMMEGL